LELDLHKSIYFIIQYKNKRATFCRQSNHNNRFTDSGDNSRYGTLQNIAKDLGMERQGDPKKRELLKNPNM
jgi:hypothetical protein